MFDWLRNLFAGPDLTPASKADLALVKMQSAYQQLFNDFEAELVRRTRAEAELDRVKLMLTRRTFELDRLNDQLRQANIPNPTTEA